MTNSNVLVGEIVRNKAVSRQYHTWFQWNARNANSFYGLFGSDFRKFMKRKVRDDNLGDSVRAFLELGNERNRLVHQDYGVFVLEKTTERFTSCTVGRWSSSISFPVHCGNSTRLSHTRAPRFVLSSDSPINAWLSCQNSVGHDGR